MNWSHCAHGACQDSTRALSQLRRAAVALSAHTRTAQRVPRSAAAALLRAVEADIKVPSACYFPRVGNTRR